MVSESITTGAQVIWPGWAPNKALSALPRSANLRTMAAWEQLARREKRVLANQKEGIEGVPTCARVLDNYRRKFYILVTLSESSSASASASASTRGLEWEARNFEAFSDWRSPSPLPAACTDCRDSLDQRLSLPIR